MSAFHCNSSSSLRYHDSGTCFKISSKIMRTFSEQYNNTFSGMSVVGSKVELRVLGNWGHSRRVGLTQVSFFGSENQLISPLSVKSTGKVLIKTSAKFELKFSIL